MFHKVSKRFPVFFICSQLLFALENPLFSDTISVMTNSNDPGETGSLPNALLIAEDGSIIDCSPIAGQTIGVDVSRLPAIGYKLTSPTSSITILGSGVIINGGGQYPAFSLVQGSAIITDLIFQNGHSQGGNGGAGYAGGGGATGGGGALYIHSGAVMTISAVSLNKNVALGGNGGAGSSGGSGGGGGGFSGGNGGSSTSLSGAAAGAAGGGGGNSGGASGGTVGAGNPNSFSNFGGAGGGGERPGSTRAGGGGTVAATAAPSPSIDASVGGVCTSTEGGGGGGGAGSGQSGSAGSDASSGGEGGAGGHGFDAGGTYGAGGGGAGGGGGGEGIGASGGGGGCGGTLTGDGGAGGVFGGGGGASGNNLRGRSGGNGGFGAGGGAGYTAGLGSYGGGDAGVASTMNPAGGGGGSGYGGAIFVQQGARLIVEDGVSFSGNSTMPGSGGIASGGNSGGAGSALGNDIFVQSGGSVTFQINGTVIVPNPIDGAGSLSEVTGPGVLMSGMGTVNLNGANTYLGDTQIQSGTLNLNGSVTGDVIIESGGTLSGNATVNGSIYNSGTISPGNSIGECFTTDLYLSSTSVYNVEIDSAGDSDEIIASGFAQVGGGVVVIPDDVNFTTPLTYTIISTSSGVTGTFSSLTSSDPALMSLIYNPLTVQLTYLPIDIIGLTGNALNAANCYATLSGIPGSDAATVNNTLLALGYNDIQKAFEQMGPAQFSGLTEIQLLDAILVRSTYTKHLAEFCFENDPSCGRSISLWIDGISQWQNQKKSGNQFGYNDTTLGATIGADYSIDNFVLGLAFSATHDNPHLKHFNSKAIINSYYGGLYGLWNYNGFYMNAAFLGAHNHYKTTRKLSFGTIDRHSHSKHNGNDWLVNLGLGYQSCSSRFQWTPYINLDYVGQHEQGYTETGADSLDLHVKAKNAALFQGDVGVVFSTTFDAWEGVFEPMFTLAYINQTPFYSKNYYASFVDSTCVFTGRGGDYKRNLFAPRLAFAYKGCCDWVNASIYYDGQVGRRYWAQDIGFDLTFRF